MPDPTPDTSTAVATAPAPDATATAAPTPAALPAPAQPQDAQPTSDQIAPDWTSQAGALATGDTGNTDNGSQPTQPPPSTVTQVQRPPDALSQHPAVQKASLLHRVAETIAGGPKVRTTYNDDGTVTREPVPLTNRQILTGAVANILAGIANTGNGYLAGREGRPVPAPQPLPTQVAQQKQAQQSEDDFNRKQNQIIQTYKVRSAQYAAMQAAYLIGKKDDEAKDAVVANHADDLENYNRAGIVQASGIPSDQLLKQGYDKSKYLATPDGKVPVFNADGSRATNKDGVPLSQLTYSVVDGTTQAPLTQQKYDQYVAAGLMKSNNPNFKLPDGATISTATQSMMNYQLDLLAGTQKEIDEVAGPGKVNVIAAAKANPGVLKALQALHNDASSTDLVEQINNLKNGTKTTKPNPNAAGIVTNLIGADNLKSYAAKQQAAANQAAADQAGKVEGSKEAAKVAADNSPAAIQGAAAKKAAENAVNPTSAPTAGLSGEAYLKTLNPGMASTVKAIGEGRQDISTLPKGKERQAYINALNQAYPGFDESKTKAYQATRKDFTSGKTSQGIDAINTALGHLGEVNDNIGYLSTLPGISTLDKLAGGQAATLNTASNLVADEIGKAYKAGTVTEGERDQYLGLLKANTPQELKANVKELATLLNGKFDALKNKWANGMPAGVVLPVQLVTPNAAAVYEKITGNKLENTTSAPTPQAAPARTTKPQTPAAKSGAGAFPAGSIPTN